MICEDFRQRYLSAKEALQAVSSLTNKSTNPVSLRPVTTHIISNKPKLRINKKLIISLVSLILMTMVGFIIFSRSPNLNPRENKTSPQKEAPAF